MSPHSSRSCFSSWPLKLFWIDFIKARQWILAHGVPAHLLHHPIFLLLLLASSSLLSRSYLTWNMSRWFCSSLSFPHQQFLWHFSTLLHLWPITILSLPACHFSCSPLTVAPGCFVLSASCPNPWRISCSPVYVVVCHPLILDLYLFSICGWEA